MTEAETKPRVLVSSVVDGFEKYREAARDGILAAGGTPVLVNEDFPSLVHSPRNACLDAVDSSDCVVSIVGARGGWTSPSGKLVVEEEYERAVARKLPVIAFIQTVDRDDDAEHFARTLSNYVDGKLRRTFSTPDELRAEVARALKPLLGQTTTRLTMPRSLQDHFSDPYTVQGMTMLRFVLTPERAEEVIDPMMLGSATYLERLYHIAHSGDVRLLSYQRSKEAGIENDSLVVTQSEERDGRHGEGEVVRIQISESGEIVIDANVTGRMRRGSGYNMLDSMVLAVEDIEAVLELCFKFCSTFYDDIDKFKRHQRFFLNVGLSGIGHRTMERNPQQRTSFAMRMYGDDKIIAFNVARTVSRDDLTRPQHEIARIITMFSRQMAS